MHQRKFTPIPRRSTQQIRPKSLETSQLISPKSLESSKQVTPKSPSTPSETMEDINVVKLLSKAKFPVYLAHSEARNQSYALKIFNFEDDKPHSYFKNEARF